jgi:hypothetical protein
LDPSNAERELLAKALDDFTEAMRLRTERNVRAAKRVTVMLRAGMLSTVLFGALLAGMLWAFTDRVRVMIDVLSTMRVEFGEMSGNMADMRATLTRIQEDMAAFAIVTNEMHLTRQTVSALNRDVGDMASRTALMSAETDLITKNVYQMNQSFRLLTPSVGRIGVSVDQGAAPAKTFNNLFPFSWMPP